MNKETLNKGVENYIKEFHEVLQMISDTLNQGQRQKLLKNEKIKEKFDVYGVTY